MCAASSAATASGTCAVYVTTVVWATSAAVEVGTRLVASVETGVALAAPIETGWMGRARA